MIIKSKDEVDVDVTFCDAGYPPDAEHKSPILNTTAVWCKVEHGEWIKSPHRSAMMTAWVVRRNNAKDLASALSGKELTHEGTEGSSTGGSAENAAKLQSLQGHSTSDADEGPAGKPEV